MCGLTGFIHRGDRSPEGMAGILRNMTRCLEHRGPDGKGLWVEGSVGLGQRRLAVVDLSDAGAQPMHSACGRYVIVFNGEIYNHAGLRKQLNEAGAAPAWRGHSDTETLLAAVAHWGLREALIRCKGMFALGLWDREARRMYLARDRAGEKPLYWGWCAGDLAFGSELKAIGQHPAAPKEICRSALAQYLRFGYVPAPRSIHPGLYKLEPGCILEIGGIPPSTPPAEPLRPGESYGSISISRYWSLNDIIEAGAQARFSDEGEALGQLEKTLRAAVASQMVADVPLGAFLSGGVDSSLIVAMMQAQSDRRVKTFTIGFENKAFNEAPHAAAVARHLGTEHTEMLVTDKEAQEVIPLLTAMYDEPFADSSQVPTHLVSKVARAQVTVALSGDAGDELFGGYNRYFWGPKIWRYMDWMSLAVRQGLGALIASVPISVWDGIGSFASPGIAVAQPGDKAHKLAARLKHVSNLDDLYCSLVSEWPGAAMVRGLNHEPASALDDPIPEALTNDPVGRMMFQDMRSYLPDDILCKVDRAAMATSLETRVPFLDRDVMAFAARLPPDMKIRDGQGKWALRQILYRHVPRELIERPKAGFGIPIGEWLRGPLRAWAEDLLSPASLSKDGLLEPAPIVKAWKEHLTGRRDWTHRLWIVLMFIAWRDSRS